MSKSSRRIHDHDVLLAADPCHRVHGAGGGGGFPRHARGSRRPPPALVTAWLEKRPLKPSERQNVQPPTHPALSNPLCQRTVPLSPDHQPDCQRSSLPQTFFSPGFLEVDPG
uniref:Uncharacterized protein n=1 Tax=Sphaerodactylus townsendi TaxID=933632 RepID=A0ACB8F191_9SAUR